MSRADDFLEQHVSTARSGTSWKLVIFQFGSTAIICMTFLSIEGHRFRFALRLASWREPKHPPFALCRDSCLRSDLTSTTCVLASAPALLLRWRPLRPLIRRHVESSAEDRYQTKSTDAPGPAAGNSAGTRCCASRFKSGASLPPQCEVPSRVTRLGEQAPSVGNLREWMLLAPSRWMRLGYFAQAKRIVLGGKVCGKSGARCEKDQ